jgi:hypothetical protein
LAKNNDPVGFLFIENRSISVSVSVFRQALILCYIQICLSDVVFAAALVASGKTKRRTETGLQWCARPQQLMTPLWQTRDEQNFNFRL